MWQMDQFCHILKEVSSMCDMSMQDMIRMQDEVASLRRQLNALTRYLKVDLLYKPESYEVVKAVEAPTLTAPQASVR